ARRAARTPSDTGLAPCMIRRQPPPREYEKSPDDLFADEVRAACAKAMAQHLKGSLNLQRTIGSMNAQEMQALAECCTATWIGMHGDRILQGKEPDTKRAKEIRNLLMGG